MRWPASLLLSLSGLVWGAASPVDFGRGELQNAIQARGLKPERFRIVTEHSMVLPPDGFSIQGALIRGGNLRGIMYGLLEAAAQVRQYGALRPAKASPALEVRGVRWMRPLPEDPQALFQALARARFNRFVAAIPGGSQAALWKAAEAAATHGVDFGAVAGGGATPQWLLAAAPRLKFIEARPDEASLEAITGAGRLMTLDLDGASLEEERFAAARATGLPLRVIVRPGAFRDYLRKPEVSERHRPWQVIWRLRAAEAAGPAAVRAAVPWLAAGGTQGFELEVRATPVPLFIEIWGRLAYNPEEPDKLLLAQANAPPSSGSELLAALDAAATFCPAEELQPLAELTASPAGNPWQASPEEAARLSQSGELSAKSRPVHRIAALEAAARNLERLGELFTGLKPLARQARLAARRLSAADDLAWARATGDAGALNSAKRNVVAALALAPEMKILQADLELLDAEPLQAARPPVPVRYPGEAARPSLVHLPPQRAPAGQPLVLALRVWPQTGVDSVRLHWRQRDSGASWQAMQAPPSRAVFTLPPGEVTAAHDIEYFFEVLHSSGPGWFVPEPLPCLGWGFFIAETALPAAQ